MTMSYFGVRWDSPAMDRAVEVATPVGQPCLMCMEPIETGESGIVTPYIGVAGTAELRPEHIECWLRSILGSVAHLEHRCTCFGGSAKDFDNRPYRVVARETMSWLVEHEGNP